jgi:hypothetical protein
MTDNTPPTHSEGALLFGVFVGGPLVAVKAVDVFDGG